MTSALNEAGRDICKAFRIGPGRTMRPNLSIVITASILSDYAICHAKWQTIKSFFRGGRDPPLALERFLAHGLRQMGRPRGGGEFPVEALPQALDFAIRNGDVRLKCE
jgi:hypothetical protein